MRGRKINNDCVNGSDITQFFYVQGFKTAHCSARAVTFHEFLPSSKNYGLDRSLVSYVVVHNLVHLIGMNHTNAFRDRVERIVSDWCDRKCWLAHKGQVMIFYDLISNVTASVANSASQIVVAVMYTQLNEALSSFSEASE